MKCVKAATSDDKFVRNHVAYVTQNFKICTNHYLPKVYFV